MKKTKVVILARVSTNTQDFQRQIDDLRDYSKKMDYEVLEVYAEQISGAKKNEDREGLSNMLNYLKSNKVDKVLSWEMSRIGRSTIEVLKTIEALNKLGVSLFIRNFNLETLDQDGKINPLSNLMIQILSSISEMERTQIQQRMSSGYSNFRKNGGVVGRKKGYRKSKERLLNDHSDIVKYLRKGRSVREVMKLTDKSNGTVMKIKNLERGEKHI